MAENTEYKISSIQFKRGEKVILEERLVAGDLGIPIKGEPIYETDTNKLKIGDGIHSYAALDYLKADIPQVDIYLIGYYSGTDFYTSSTYTEKLVHDNQKIYIDMNTYNFYKYHGDTVKFKPAFNVSQADEVTPGIMKLYKTNGQNEDGTMTQKAITNSVSQIGFSVDASDSECLVLVKPW